MPSLAQLTRRTLLRRVSLFSELDDAELDALPTATQALRKREVLMRKGDEGSTAYVLMSGRLKITTEIPEGRELVLQIIEPGAVVGELALLDQGPRSASITAIEPARVMVIHRHSFLDFLRRHPEVSLKLLLELGARTRKLISDLEDSIFLGLTERLARRLLALAASYGRQVANGVLIDLKVSQQGLGEMVGFSRESTNKQIQAWTREGVLKMTRGFITIHDRAALVSQAHLSAEVRVPGRK
jgi:CRP-like cAMP-binding protein